MADAFVAINDTVHTLLRSLTRRVPLCPQRAGLNETTLEYRPRPDDLPEAYYTLAVYHGLRGTPLRVLPFGRWRVEAAARRWVPERANYFDAPSLDRRCSRDLRLKLRRRGPGLVAGDLLSFGVGTLRARNDNPADPLQVSIWRDHGRFTSRCEKSCVTIRALPWDCLPLFRGSGKESFDSTNVIYGDALGEIEQIWDRRADTMFLDQVAQELQGMRRHALLGASLCPPLNAGAAVKMHLRAQAVWKVPPASGRALLRRVEHVLNHLVIDSVPDTEFRGGSPTEPLPPKPAGAPWESDPTGYDGWLFGANPAS